MVVASGLCCDGNDAVTLFAVNLILTFTSKRLPLNG